jgi:hypothetical protein
MLWQSTVLARRFTIASSRWTLKGVWQDGLQPLATVSGYRPSGGSDARLDLRDGAMLSNGRKGIRTSRLLELAGQALSDDKRRPLAFLPTGS